LFFSLIFVLSNDEFWFFVRVFGFYGFWVKGVVMKHYLICFDIQHDSTRRRLSRLLEKYGVRVQGSVFECTFKSSDRKRKLQVQIQNLLKQSDVEETNVRFYSLSKEALKHCHDVYNNPIAQLPAIIVL